MVTTIQLMEDHIFYKDLIQVQQMIIMVYIVQIQEQLLDIIQLLLLSIHRMMDMKI